MSRLRSPFLRLVTLFGVSLVCLAAASAARAGAQLQTVATPAKVMSVPSRITEEIDSSTLVQLRGNIHGMAKPQYDKGPVGPEFQLPHMTLMLKPSADQQRAIDKLLLEQQDPSSPNYHKWLTPQEYGNRFGLGKSDMGKIVGWLEAQGFRIQSVANGRDWVAFSGTADQVSRVFSTEIHRYAVQGEDHYANATAPWVPAAVADVVSYIHGLHDFRPRPAGALINGSHYLLPNDVATIYDINPLYNMTPPVDGTGQTVVVTGQSDVDLSNITYFRTWFGLPTNVIPHMTPVIPAPGRTNDSNESEAYLDLEWIGAIARNATIYYVYALSTLDAVDWAIDNATSLDPNPSVVTHPSVISYSFTSCEQICGKDYVLTRLVEAKKASTEGITWIASSGDSGSAGCDAFPVTEAEGGPAVNYPADLAYVTAVGGTEFSGDLNNPSLYWDANGSAMEYIPETAWHDTGADYPSCGLPFAGHVASGGGRSLYIDKPWFQVGITPDDNSRDVPDLALSASGCHDPYPVYGWNKAQKQNTWAAMGGTSAAAPVFAGIVALLNQYLGYNNSLGTPGLGMINPRLYQLAQSGDYRAIFHDVDGGDNIVPCRSDLGGCAANGPPWEIGYSAGTNYDQVTGLGSVDAYNLITNWNPTLSVTLTANPSLGTSPLTTTLMAAVSGSASGTINYTFWYNCQDPSNSVSEVMSSCGTIPTPATLGTCVSNSVGEKCNGMAASSQSVAAVYSSPGVYTAKIIAEQGSATPAENRISITLNSSPLSMASVSFSSYSVTADSAVSGTVTLNGAAPSNGALVVLTGQPSGIVRLPSNVPVPAGSTTGTFTAATWCVPAHTPVVVTASYDATQATATLNVDPQPSTVGVAGLNLSPSTVNSGGSFTGTINLTGRAPSCGAYVTLAASPQGVLQLPPPVTVPSGGTTATFSVGALPVSSATNVTVTATYNNTSPSATVTVNPSNSPVVVSNLSFNPASTVGGNAANGTVTLSGPAPSGGATVTFTSTPSGLVQLSSVTASAGSASAPFSAQTSAVNSNTVVSITASYNGSSANATLTLTPPGGSVVLSNFTITPATIVGGYTSQGNVFLTGNAPSSGATVYLVSNNTQFVRVPPKVTVQPGNNNVAFPITTFCTGSTVGATITASYNGTMYGTSLTVLPVAVSAVTFSSNSVTAGNGVSITVWLSGPAPAGAYASLTSSNPSVLPIPPSVSFATGSVSASVTATAQAVGPQTTVSVTASYNNSSAQGSLTVVPAVPLTVNSFWFSPSTVTGGSSASGSVTLTGLAPTGGANVMLSSGSPLVQVPSTVTVAAGSWSVPVTAQTSAVSSITNVTVTATYGGGSQRTTLTLVPPLPFLASLSLSPTTVISGSSATGTVTLTAPAPLGGLVVDLTSTVTYSVARLSNNAVVVAQGATSGVFSVTAASIDFIATATITASYNGTSQNATLTIVPLNTPLAPSSLTLNPLEVAGGSTSTGTVSLTGLAPIPGVVLNLSSDNQAVQVPLTVTVPPGLQVATFVASTSSVPDTITATITATYNGLSQSCLLTVKPSGSPPPSNPVPFLTSPLGPLSQIPGGVGFPLTLNGTGFVPGAQVLWNGTALPTTYVSSSELQAAVSGGSVQTNGTAQVVVSNPGQLSLLSNPLPEHLTYATSAPAFSSSSQAVSGSPYSVALGDLNGDGVPDLVVAKSDGSGLSIFLGNGDGTFGPELIIPSINTNQVVLGDLNGDGKLDIAFNKSGSSNGAIGIFLGDGDGTFTAMPDVLLPSSPSNNAALALGDLNGDGNLDLVVTGNYLTQAYVLLGKGDGTFGTPATFGSVNQPHGLALGDFNGDGKLDVALPDYANKAVAILFGNGDGTFQTQHEYPTNGYAGALTVADFNGDGHPDIAVANEGPIGSAGSGIAVLLNNGDGTFASPLTVGSGQIFYYLVSDDFNGDGKLDLLTVTFQPSRQAQIFLGNGDGTFSLTPITMPVTNPASIAAGDINGDGAPDILVPNSSSGGGVSILLQSVSPIIQVSVPSISFSATQGGGNSSPVSLTISNTGGGTETWTAAASQTWVMPSQTSGTAPSTINIAANPSGLNPGTYNDSIAITATGASNSPIMVPVTFIINPVPVVVGSLAFSPSVLTGPGTATGTVTLSGPAPVGGVTVSLSSTNAAVQVPSTMAVAAGLLSGSFTATASAVTAQTSATVTASYNGVSTAAMLTVNPAPTLASLSPSSAMEGGAAFTLTVTGTNFVSGSTVGWNGSARTTTFVSGTQLTAAISASDIATAGTVSVSVANPSPGGGTSNPLTFTINNPVPTATLLSPSTATAGGSAFSLTVTGTNFVSGSTVEWNSSARTTGFVSSTQLTAAVLASDIATGGTASVTVVNPAPGGGTSSGLTFTINNPNPGAGLSPTSEAFGNQVMNTTSAARTVTLTSTGTTNLNILSVTITGTNAGDFHETNACPATLAPAAKCTISLTYTPTVLGAETASLIVADNASNSPQTVTLTGTGIVPAYLSAASLSFGSVGENSPSAAKTLTFYNNEASALAIASIATGNPDFTETNTCGGSVPGKGRCTISVTFEPSIIGAETGTLTVTDAASNSPQTAALTGAGVVPAYLSAPSLSFGSVGENSPSAAKTLTFYNNEAAALTIASIATGNPDFTETNTCGASVPGKGRCTISVTFEPSIIGAETGTLTVTDAASNSPQTAALTGTGILPATLSAATLAFGNVGENSPSVVRNITLTNNHTVALPISTITTGNPDYTETDNCTPSVAGKGSCIIHVTLRPTTLGADNGTLTVNDGASNSPQTAALTGTGILPATLSAATLAFGNVPQSIASTAENITVTNNQTVALGISSITFTGTNPGDFGQTNPCGGTVAPKGTCIISVTYTPSILGPETATLNVNDGASNTPQTASLSGTGTAQATVSPTSLAFAAQTAGTTSAARTVTLTNNLSTALTISSITFTGADPSDFGSPTNTCGGSLAAKSHCTISVTFAPTATGTRTATLNVNDSANDSPQTAGLTGTGN